MCGVKSGLCHSILGVRETSELSPSLLIMLNSSKEETFDCPDILSVCIRIMSFHASLRKAETLNSKV